MVGISFGIGLGFYWIPVEFVAGLKIFFFLFYVPVNLGPRRTVTLAA